MNVLRRIYLLQKIDIDIEKKRRNKSFFFRDRKYLVFFI